MSNPFRLSLWDTCIPHSQFDCLIAILQEAYSGMHPTYYLLSPYYLLLTTYYLLLLLTGGTFGNASGLAASDDCVPVRSGFWSPLGSNLPQACPASGSLVSQ